MCKKQGIGLLLLFLSFSSCSVISMKESQLIWKHLYSHMIILIFHAIVRKKGGMYLILHIRSVGINIANIIELFHLQISALSILLSYQSEDHRYLPSWEFGVALKDKSESGEITCEILFTAGRTKLAQKIFHFHYYGRSRTPSSSYTDRPISSYPEIGSGLSQFY